MKQLIGEFCQDESGQNLVEYGLLAAIVALGAIAALTSFRTVITTAWTNISSMLSN